MNKRVAVLGGVVAVSVVAVIVGRNFLGQMMLPQHFTPPELLPPNTGDSEQDQGFPPQFFFQTTPVPPPSTVDGATLCRQRGEWGCSHGANGRPSVLGCVPPLQISYASRISCNQVGLCYSCLSEGRLSSPPTGFTPPELLPPNTGDISLILGGTTDSEIPPPYPVATDEPGADVSGSTGCANSPFLIFNAEQLTALMDLDSFDSFQQEFECVLRGRAEAPWTYVPCSGTPQSLRDRFNIMNSGRTDPHASSEPHYICAAYGYCEGANERCAVVTRGNWLFGTRDECACVQSAPPPVAPPTDNRLN